MSVPDTPGRCVQTRTLAQRRRFTGGHVEPLHRPESRPAAGRSASRPLRSVRVSVAGRPGPDRVDPQRQPATPTRCIRTPSTASPSTTTAICATISRSASSSPNPRTAVRPSMSTWPPTRTPSPMRPSARGSSMTSRCPSARPRTSSPRAVSPSSPAPAATRSSSTSTASRALFDTSGGRNFTAPHLGARIALDGCGFQHRGQRVLDGAGAADQRARAPIRTSGSGGGAACAATANYCTSTGPGIRR